MPDDSPPAPDPLLRGIAERIRARREAAGQSRKALALHAAVSERYLAQLEGGTGNASIQVLARIADALEVPLTQLIAEPDPLIGRLSGASAAERAEVARILEPGAGRGGRIALTGLRGAGKSTLGPMLAKTLGLPFRELNGVIAQDAGIPAGEVMALYGEAAYRRRERAALESLADGPPMVLAAAGGMVAEPDTYELLLNRFLTVWLRASPEEHMARVRAQGDDRPMRGNPQAMDELRAILAARAPAYARARLTLDTSGTTPDASRNALMKDLQPLLDDGSRVMGSFRAPET